MNNEGIVFLGVIIFVCIFTLSIEYKNMSETQMKVSAGLEECPQTPSISTSTTIWVKDCSKYMSDYSKHVSSEINK